MFEEDSTSADLVDRILEAKIAIAWAAKPYVELYGELPQGATWNNIMDLFEEAEQSIKSSMAEEGGLEKS